MAIIQNKDIYDDSKGNPFKPILDMLEILDKKIIDSKSKLVDLERQVKETGVGKTLIANTQKLAAETQKLTSYEKAELAIKQQLERANEKYIAQQNSQLGLYQKESIQLNKLRTDYKNLAAEEKHLTQEGRQLYNEISRLDRKLKNIDSSVGQFQRNVGNYTSAFNKFGASIKNFFSAGIIVAGISYLRNFGKEIIELGGAVAGTRKNFDQLNRPDLLIKLREATGNTVSDIELMRATLDADDFKANLDNLPLYFAYARKEVQETGGSVTDLVAKIIKGLGKESPKVLTELGISTRDFKEELAKTGDYAQAVTNIMTTRMKEAGTYVETASDVTARWAARWENIKANAGSLLNTVLVKISPVLEKVWDTMNRLWIVTTDFIIDFVNGWIELYNESAMFRSMIETIALSFKLAWNTVKLFFSLMLDNLKNVGSTLAYVFNPKNWGEGFGKGLADNMAKGGQRIIDDFKEFGTDSANAFTTAFENTYKGQRDKLTRESFNFLGGGTGVNKKTPEGSGGAGRPAIDANGNVISSRSVGGIVIDPTEQKAKQNADLLALQSQYYNDMAALRAQDAKDEEEREAKKREAIQDTMEIAGQQFGELLAQGRLSYKEFGKFLLTTALDIAEKMILLSLAEMTAKQIAQKGFAGIATAAVLTGLVKGIFAGIKSQVMKFAEGTDYVNGPGSGKSDSIPAMLSKGEGVINAENNMRLLRTGLGINDRRLPALVSAGLSTIRMESELKEIKNHIAQSSWYLSNFEVHYEDKQYKYIKDVKTGIVHKIIKA